MSSTELAKRDEIGSAIESVLIQGNLAQLNPEQRVSYYKAVCDSVGLNPLTKPFDYITLNGKLVLYATKGATDQLRNVHRVSVQIVDRSIVDDCYVVTAKAINPDGRCDESTGAVTIAGLKGDAKCNAMMKAETKAKRRVTLSLCGLGMLDESEIETIPQSRLQEVKRSESPVTFSRASRQDTANPDVTNTPGKAAVETDEPPAAHQDSEPAGETTVKGQAQETPTGNGASAGSEYISSDDAQQLHFYAYSLVPQEMKTKKGLVPKELRDKIDAAIEEWARSKYLINDEGRGTLTKVRRVYPGPDNKGMDGITRIRGILKTVIDEMLGKAEPFEGQF